MDFIGTCGGMPGAVSKLLHEYKLSACFAPADLVGVKMHFGEQGHNPPIQPAWVRAAVVWIRNQNAQAFLTDTCVLYKSQRDNAVSHLKLATNYGFNVNKTGAPVIIADGLTGNEETEVAIPGQIYDRVFIAAAAVQANALLVLSHVTGHLLCGMGGAIKNLGMGLASRKGKLRQHSGMKPNVSPTACTGCEECTKWCPVEAIAMHEGIASIDHAMCTGCGECVTVCRFDAVTHDWRTGSDELQRRIAEHALGAVIRKPGKVAYVNFLTNITKDCDCIARNHPAVLPDIGLVAGTDPVAVDAASMDLIREMAQKTISDVAYPHLDPWTQVRHGEEIGLGSRDYGLIRL